MQIPGTFGDSGLIQKLRGGGWAKVFPILKHPNDFPLRRDLKRLYDVGPVSGFCTTSGTEDYRVAGSQTVGRLDVVKSDVIRKVGLLELPHSFAFPVYLANKLVVFIVDESIAIM